MLFLLLRYRRLLHTIGTYSGMLPLSFLFSYREQLLDEHVSFDSLKVIFDGYGRCNKGNDKVNNKVTFFILCFEPFSGSCAED